MCIQARTFVGLSMALKCRDLSILVVCTELADLGITLIENCDSNRHAATQAEGALERGRASRAAARAADGCVA